MLNSEYAKLEDIPVEKHGAYVLKDGKYVLDRLGEDHPLVVHKTQLERDLSTEKGKTTKATNEKIAAEARALPEGQVAVPAAEAQVLNEVKATGVPLAEVKQRVADYPQLKKTVDEQAEARHLADVAKVMGWKSEALQAISDKLPPLEIRDKMENGQKVTDDDGKPAKVVVAKIKGADGVVTEKPFDAYFGETETLKIFEPSLLAEPKAEGGTELPVMGFGGGGDKSLAASLINSRYMDDPPAGAGAGART